MSTDTSTAWLPIAVSEQVNDSAPLRVTAGGREYALFRDTTGAVRAVEDRCPHRRVPLSLGKVIDGNIRCAYHGWTFDGESGSCVAVPNLGADERVSPNYCVTAYAIRESAGFVYVAPQPGRSSADLAFERDKVAPGLVLQTTGSGVAPVALAEYRDALLDGPQILFRIAGVRITDFFLGDAALCDGRVILDREAEWGNPGSAATIDANDRPLILRSELAENQNHAVYRLYDDQQVLLAEILLAFNSAPRGATSFCWRFRRYDAFAQRQPRANRLRYAMQAPFTAFSAVNGSALSGLLVGPSHDFHSLVTG